MKTLIGNVRTANAKNFLTAVNGGGLGGANSGPGAVPLHTDATAAGIWETFKLILQPGSPSIGPGMKFALQTSSGNNYVTAVNGGGIGGPNNGSCPVHTDATSAGAWETFTLQVDDTVNPPTVKISPFNLVPLTGSRYLTAVNGGGMGGPNTQPVLTSATSVGANELFSFDSPLAVPSGPPVLAANFNLNGPENGNIAGSLMLNLNADGSYSFSTVTEAAYRANIGHLECFVLLKFRSMAEAQTLNCPMCGAPASSVATSCEHCGARLATVACPSCFGMMFLGQKFCPHCGAKAERSEVAGADTQLCPRCRVGMEAIALGKVNLRECPHCAGIWADAETLHEICDDREEQAAVLGMADHAPPAQAVSWEQQVRYVPCPICKKLMNRVNFANCSHVIVDVCSKHGTWFDKDELRRIVEFIRAGGLEQARAQQLADLEARRLRLAAAQNPDGWAASASLPHLPDSSRDGLSRGISAAAAVLKCLFR